MEDSNGDLTEGVKFDGDKPRYDLIPALALHELALVYTMGAKKYADRNWELGMEWSRLFGAILRHSFAWFRGETHDPESGLHHMAHAAFSCLALTEYHFTKKGKDDRPYEDKQKPDHYRIHGVLICNHDKSVCDLPTIKTRDNADQGSPSSESERNDLRSHRGIAPPLDGSKHISESARYRREESTDTTDG